MSHCLISIIMSVSIMLCLCACGKTVSTKSIYETELESLNSAIAFLKKNPSIHEITHERPFLSEYSYSKCGKVYFLTTTEEKIEESDDTQIINELMKKIIYIFPENEDGQFFVSFQTVSKFGEGEELIYTESGNEYPDEYHTITEWLNDNWYIART